MGGLGFARIMWSLTYLVGLPTLLAVEKARAVGLACYSPALVERRRRPRGRGREVIRLAAYPGYLLLEANVDLERLRIRFSGWHIRRLTGRGALLTDGQVEELRELERQWQAAALAPRQRFERGTAVLVSMGLFEGRRGLVHADNGRQVVLDVHGLPGPISMPCSCLLAWQDKVGAAAQRRLIPPVRTSCGHGSGASLRATVQTA